MGANPDKILILAPKSSTEGNDCRKQESGLKNGEGPKPPASRKSRKRRLPLSLLAPSAARSDLPPEPREDGADSRAATATQPDLPPEEDSIAPRRRGEPRRDPHAGPLTLSPPALLARWRPGSSPRLSCFPCLCGCAPVRSTAGVAWSVEWSVDAARAPPGKAR